jgi:protein TonB
MSVGDRYDVERTGDFAVTRIRPRRSKPAQVDPHLGVAITVLTDDAALADAIHDAAAANHPVATASAVEEAIELARHGRCGILITDQLSAHSTLQRVTERLREAEPALVVVAVGSPGDQHALMSLLSAGIVDRLMLKPVAPSLAQTVLKSAVQQHRTLQGPATAVALAEQPEPAVVMVELQRHAASDLTEVRPRPAPAEIVAPASSVATSTPADRMDPPRPSWIAVVAALIIGAGVMGWIATDRTPAIDAQAVIANNLAAAQRALREGHAFEPRGQSALDYYNTVLALDPANTDAQQGLDQIADRFATQAAMAIARGQVAAAIVALDSVRRIRPEHRQLEQLQAQLQAAQEKLAASVPAHAQPAPPPAKAPPAASASRQSVDAQARAVAKAAEALKREREELAKAQQQFAAKVQAAETQLAAARNEVVELPPTPIVAAPPPAPAPHTPKLARMVRPQYPDDALRYGTEGWVNVRMSVMPTGDVLDPWVESSSNGSMFNRAALAAVRKWKYEPFASAGPQSVTVRVEFRMEER